MIFRLKKSFLATSPKELICGHVINLIRFSIVETSLKSAHYSVKILAVCLSYKFFKAQDKIESLIHDKIGNIN